MAAINSSLFIHATCVQPGYSYHLFHNLGLIRDPAHQDCKDHTNRDAAPLYPYTVFSIGAYTYCMAAGHTIEIFNFKCVRIISRIKQKLQTPAIPSRPLMPLPSKQSENCKDKFS